jgi:hypothetical protein
VLPHSERFSRAKAKASIIAACLARVELAESSRR